MGVGGGLISGPENRKHKINLKHLACQGMKDGRVQNLVGLHQKSKCHLNGLYCPKLRKFEHQH